MLFQVHPFMKDTYDKDVTVSLYVAEYYVSSSPKAG